MISPRKPNIIDTIIAKNIRRIRKQKGFTTYELAAVLNISQVQFSKYEIKGARIPASRLMLLAIAMDVSILEFFKNPEN